MENQENEFLDINEEYKLPEQKEIVLDIAGNKTLDTKDLSPIEMIRLTAKENNIRLKEFPVKYNKLNQPYPFDTGCRNNGCNGRGYIGWDNNIPIPCKCLFHPDDRDGKKVINRKINRQITKMAHMEAKNRIQDRAEIYGLRNYHKNIWISKNGAKFEYTNVKGKYDFRRVVEK